MNKEIDFIVKHHELSIGIEVKASKKWRREYGKNLHELELDKRYVVYLGDTIHHYNGIDTLPAQDFFKLLYSSNLWST